MWSKIWQSWGTTEVDVWRRTISGLRRNLTKCPVGAGFRSESALMGDCNLSPAKLPTGIAAQRSAILNPYFPCVVGADVGIESLHSVKVERLLPHWRILSKAPSLGRLRNLWRRLEYGGQRGRHGKSRSWAEGQPPLKSRHFQVVWNPIKHFSTAQINRLSLVCIALAVMVGCNRSSTSLVVDEPLLTRYNDMAALIVSTAPSNDIDCYLDYSGGMGEGMRATAEINANLKNFLGGRSVTYYKVGAPETPPQIDINSAAANFNDLNNYKDPRSKLKVALDRMTAQKNKVSLFITDFERVDNGALRQELTGAPAPHPIDASAWGQNNFKEWLLAGNQIDIFATPFTKPDYYFDRNHAKTYPNWIYTIVFTPGSIVKNDSAFKSSVASFLLDAYRSGNAKGSKHFAYTANAFKVEQGGTSPNGNSNDNVIVQDHFTNTFNKGFEFYEFAAKDLTAFGTDATQQDKRIINKLRVTSQVPFLADVQFNIKVYDVTEPLTNLFKAATQGPPQTAIDVETGKSVTVGNKPIIVTFDRGQAVDSVFDFVYNVASHEIGIKLKPDYSGSGRTTIYKVDIVLASSTMKDFAESDQVMLLNYGGDTRSTRWARASNSRCGTLRRA